MPTHSAIWPPADLCLCLSHLSLCLLDLVDYVINDSLLFGDLPIDFLFSIFKCPLFLLPLPLEFLPDLKLLFSPLLVLVELSLAPVLCLEDLTLAPKGVHVFVLKAHIVLASGTSLGFAATVRCVFLILLELDHLVAVFAGFRLE